MDGEAPAQVTPPPNSPPPTFPESKPAAAQTPESAPAAPPAQPAATPPGTGPDGAAPKAGEPPAEKPAGEQKPPEPERVVPERYDLKLGADSLMDQASLARVESYAKTNKLTQEEAAGLLAAQEADVRAYVAEKKAGWLKEIQNDRELGGDNLARNVEMAKQFLDKHADDGLRRELDRTGYGNHPGFMRFVLKLAKASANDVAVIPGANEGVVDKSLADHFYGETTSKR